MSSARLYVCAVPIGNLEDASPRLRRVLGEVDAIACEDTRMTRQLLDLLGVDSQARLIAHHAHNERASAAGVVQLLEAGSSVALVSDAGTPAVSDPGMAVVAAAHAAGIEVIAVPGPSAVAAAVSVAGARGSCGDGGYRFVGFLPRSEAALLELLDRSGSELLVGFESPHRIRRVLDEVARHDPERMVIVCRELTKRHEQVVRGRPAELLEQLSDPVKGEIVVLVEPGNGETQPSEQAAIDLARAVRDAGVGAKDAARIASAHAGGSARAIYAALHDS